MGTGRLGRLLKTRSAAEVSGDAGFIRSKAVLMLDSKSKGKSPMVSSEPPSNQKLSLNIDTRPLNTVGTKQSYGTIGERQSIGGLSLLECDEPETYRSGHHVLFDVPEEVDDQDLEALLEDEGLYLGSFVTSVALASWAH